MSAETLYHLDKSFEENVTFGPFWNGKIETPTSPHKTTFLGHKLNSAFGVAACPLTVNSRHVSLLSRLGYDLITYKSVRSREWRGNPAPHWQYVDIAEQLSLSSLATAVMASFEPFDNAEPSMANSFGIQSVKPEYWQEDVDLAVSNLSKGQLLMLSLMCTPQEGESLVEDAKRLAKMARETSATVFELNLACPNTDGGEGLIYEDVDRSVKLLTVMKKVLGPKRHLLAKVGHYFQPQKMREFLEKTRGIISGVASTNTYSMNIRTTNDQDAFPGRPTAGVSGAAIRSLSQQQAKELVRLKQELSLDDLMVIGIGGVTKRRHIREYFDLGVDAVQSAVGVFADPLLASKYKKGKK